MSAPRFSKSLLVLALVAGTSVAFPSHAAVIDFWAYKVSLKIVAKRTIFGQQFDTVDMRKLGNKEIINLALGRPLDHAVAKTEVLAGLGTYENPSSNPLARLVVFDPTQNGSAQVLATVSQPTLTQFEKAYLSKQSQGVGAGDATIVATPGSPPNGFLSTTVHGGGEASGAHLASPNFDELDVKIKGKGIVTGPIKFNVNGQLFDGFIAKGEGKISGKPIGMFVQ